MVFPARAGDHQERVRSGGRDLQGAFGDLLANHVGEVDGFGLWSGARIIQAGARGIEPSRSSCATIEVSVGGAESASFETSEASATLGGAEHQRGRR
jgi:hypothetical protein